MGGDAGCSGSLAAAASATDFAPPTFLLHPRGGRENGSVIDLSLPATTNYNDNAAVAYWTMARNQLIAMEAVAQKDVENNDGEFLDALVKVLFCIG